MIKFTVLYDHPTDPASFDDHYLGTHRPLVEALPGLDHFDVARSLPGADGAAAPYYLVAELYFKDFDVFGAAMSSPEGANLAADAPNVASTPSTAFMTELL